MTDETRSLTPGTLMAAELAEQPEVLGRLVARHAADREQVRAVLPSAHAGTVLLARGSSDNVAVYGRYLIEMASAARRAGRAQRAHPVPGRRGLHRLPGGGAEPVRGDAGGGGDGRVHAPGRRGGHRHRQRARQPAHRRVRPEPADRGGPGARRARPPRRSPPRCWRWRRSPPPTTPRWWPPPTWPRCPARWRRCWPIPVRRAHQGPRRPSPDGGRTRGGSSSPGAGSPTRRRWRPRSRSRKPRRCTPRACPRPICCTARSRRSTRGCRCCSSPAASGSRPTRRR